MTHQDSKRTSRVEREVREIIAEKLSRGFRLETEGLLTVTRSWVSGDLKQGKIYFSFLPTGDITEEKAIRLVTTELNERADEFQEELAHKLRTRFTPVLEFIFDEGLEKGLKIQTMLRDISNKKP